MATGEYIDRHIVTGRGDSLILKRESLETIASENVPVHTAPDTSEEMKRQLFLSHILVSVEG